MFPLLVIAISIPIAPWPTAGSISSKLSTDANNRPAPRTVVATFPAMVNSTTDTGEREHGAIEFSLLRHFLHPGRDVAADFDNRAQSEGRAAQLRFAHGMLVAMVAPFGKSTSAAWDCKPETDLVKRAASR